MIVLNGLVAVLLESSLVPLPFLLWSVWYWSNRVSVSAMVWFAVLFALLNDILVVRTIGTTAVVLWLFCLLLIAIRQWFPTEVIVERGLVIIASLLWAYVFGGIRGLGLLMVLFLSLVIFQLKAERNWGIRLR